MGFDRLLVAQVDKHCAYDPAEDIEEMDVSWENIDGELFATIEIELGNGDTYTLTFDDPGMPSDEDFNYALYAAIEKEQ